MRSKTGSGDFVFRAGTGVLASVLVVIVAAIAILLWRESRVSVHEFGWQFWRTDTWDPVSGEFGARPFIWGTLYSSVLAIVIATPIALGIAIYVSELAPAWLQRPLVFLTELLAAVPSIVYGLWGMFVLVPWVRQFQVATPAWLKSVPLFTGPPLGVGMLSAALVLSVMVIPFISSVAREVLRAVPQALVLFYLVQQGVTSLDWPFFTRMPVPHGETGGGMANSILGSLMVTGIGALGAIPIGIAAGIYAAEFRGTRLAAATRFAADTLNGVPSIVVGVFAYGIAVLPFHQFSALAGGLALGIMMLPLVMRTTEELLLLVPGSLKEGALALGATRGRAVFTVVLPAALPGILTGVLLALARVAGETAPLLFTALNNQFFSGDPRQPISTLTVQVFNYANSPYQDLHRQAWAGALVLVTIVLSCSLLARLATARLERMQRGS
jgi:phosphate transport system permease protein